MLTTSTLRSWSQSRVRRFICCQSLIKTTRTSATETRWHRYRTHNEERVWTQESWARLSTTRQEWTCFWGIIRRASRGRQSTGIRARGRWAWGMSISWRRPSTWKAISSIQSRLLTISCRRANSPARWTRETVCPSKKHFRRRDMMLNLRDSTLSMAQALQIKTTTKISQTSCSWWKKQIHLIDEN